MNSVSMALLYIISYNYIAAYGGGGEKTIWGRIEGGDFVLFLAFFDVSDALYCLQMAAKTTSVLLVFRFHY